MESVQNMLMKGPKGPVQLAAAATAVLATSALVYYRYFSAGGDTSLAPAIEEEEAKKIMNVIFKNVKILVPKLLMAAQNIKMQIQQQGQDVEEALLLKQYLLPHFVSGVQDIQDKALEEFGVDEDELEEAVNKYIADGDEELASIVKGIRVMHQQFGGDTEVDDPDAPKSAKMQSMGIAEVVALLKELGNQMMQYTDDFCGKFIDEHGAPSTQKQMEEFQLGLMSATQRYAVAISGTCFTCATVPFYFANGFLVYG